MQQLLAKAEVDATARDFKMLVADDSPIYHELVEHTLAEKQYAVLFAKSGREAIDLFSEHQPSLVITDWMMPDLSGIRAVRAHSQSSSTNVHLPHHPDGNHGEEQACERVGGRRR